jgi:hypothetical protein
VSRAEYLDKCDAALADKPRLSAVFDPAWRAAFRAEVLAQPESAEVGYPTAYWLPMMDVMSPGMFPPRIQASIDAGLDVLWDQLSERERREFIGRIRVHDGMAACDELLAAAAFASEFGREAVRSPTAARDQRKPEFFVECPPTRWAVECKLLLDNKEVRSFNAGMMQTGAGWVASLDPDHDPNRMQWAVVEKVRRAQGGGPVVILLTSYTPWLMPEAMQAVIRRILSDFASIGLAESELPVGVACLTWTIVQGVWFSDTVCAAASIDAAMRERIRRAIVSGFVSRGDGALLTEAGW